MTWCKNDFCSGIVRHSTESSRCHLQVPVSAGGAKPEKVKVYGPGIESATQNVPTFFTVDCKEAGPGECPLQTRGFE